MACAVVLLAGLGLPVVAAGAQEPSGREPVGLADREPKDAAKGAEVVSMRDASSKTFATDQPGVFVSEVYNAPVHFEDPSTGRWEQVDPRVDLRPDGRLHSRAGAVRASVAARADEGLGRVEVPGRGAVSFELESAAPVGASRTSDTEVVFDDVMAGVDLEVTSTNLGLKEMIVLESADAPSSFRYRVTVEGGLAAELDERGNVVFRDPGAGRDADPVLWVPHGWMVDSSGTDAAYSGGVDYRIEDRGRDGSFTLVVDVDRVWLDDPARVFPVRVDPTWSSFNPDADDTFVNPMAPTTNYSTAGWLNVGGGPWVRNDAFFHLPVNQFDDMTIHLASFNVVQHTPLLHTPGCDDIRDLYRVEQSWDGTQITWDTRPTQIGDVIATTTYGFGPDPDCEGPGTLSYAITDAVRNWADDTWPETDPSVMLRARTGMPLAMVGSADIGFPYTAHVSVIWSDPTNLHIPDPPANLAPSGDVETLRPTLSATYSDPDSRNGGIAYVVYDDDTGQQVHADFGAVVASGNPSTFEVPAGVLELNTTYRLEALAIADADDDGDITDDSGDPNNAASENVATTFTTPSVSLDQPPDLSTVFDVETLTVTGLGAYTIDEVAFYVDEQLLQTDTNGTDGWTAQWDTTTETDGEHTVQAVVTDTNTNQHPSAVHDVTVANGLGGLERAEIDHQRGLLDVNQWAVLTTQLLTNRLGPSDRYRWTGDSLTDDTFDGSVATQKVAAVMGELDPEVFDQLEDMRFVPSPQAASPLLPGDPDCGDDALVIRSDSANVVYGQPRDWCVAEIPSMLAGYPEMVFYYTVDYAPQEGIDYETGDPVPSVDEYNISPVDSDASGFPDQIEDYAEVLYAAYDSYEDGGYTVPADLIGQSYLPIVIKDLSVSWSGRHVGSAGSSLSSGDWSLSDFFIELTAHIGDPGSLNKRDRSGLNAQVIAHEAFHHVQQGTTWLVSDPRSTVNQWFDESTADYVPSFYGTKSGTPLYSAAQSSNPGWHPVNVGTYPRFGFYSALSFLPIRDSNWVTTLTSLVAGDTGLSQRDYGANIFWQYLTERSFLRSKDVALYFLQELHTYKPGSGQATVDYLSILDDLLQNELGLSLEDANRDYWAAIHVLTSANTDVPEFDWLHPASDITVWRSVLEDSAYVNLKADAFGRQRAASVRRTVGAEDEAEVTETVQPGGALIVDIIPEAHHEGDLEITIETLGSNGRLDATAFAYRPSGHPDICVRSGTPELDQWSSVASTGSIRIDTLCRTASVAVVNADTDPTLSARTVRVTVAFTNTIAQPWTDAVMIGGSPKTFSPTVLARVTPSDFTVYDELCFGLEVDTGAGGGLFNFVGIRKRIWVNGTLVHNSTDVLTPHVTHHPVPAVMVGSGLPAFDVTASITAEIGTVDSWTMSVQAC